MNYKVTFEDDSKALLHYGVKGMKWGVWNQETATRYGAKGGTLKKGQVVTRVATSVNDPTYFNKKHVSTTGVDHDVWDDYIGSRQANRGVNTYNIVYTPVKDLKVASAKDLGKVYVNSILKNPENRELAKKETKTYVKDWVGQDSFSVTLKGHKKANIASGHLALQTQTGKKIIDELISQGYGAVSDVHGQNIAKDPLIVLNPDKNLKKREVYKTKYWNENYTDLSPEEKKLYNY